MRLKARRIRPPRRRARARRRRALWGAEIVRRDHRWLVLLWRAFEAEQCADGLGEPESPREQPEDPWELPERLAGGCDVRCWVVRLRRGA